MNRFVSISHAGLGTALAAAMVVPAAAQQCKPLLGSFEAGEVPSCR